MTDDILRKIHTPADIKKLPKEELAPLASQIRETLVETVSQNGGHLASNLGVVELTIAIHRVFDCPKDKIVFDVGHQAYVHKLLTGRREGFPSIRTEAGLSGFPKRNESVYDAFDTGHSSTSVSAALGMLRAARLQGSDEHVVAVIGDGALTGGMAFEALNDAGDAKLPLIVIFNDNNMSISRNVGALSKSLRKARRSRGYQRFKQKTEAFLARRASWGEKTKMRLRTIRNRIKFFLLPDNAYFENFGFKYWGPVDGHDVEQLCQVLQRAKELQHPVIVHVLTQKGHGYQPAEARPDVFHGVGKFDPQTGALCSGHIKDNAAIAGETLCELAAHDPAVAVVCAAMPMGTGMTGFAQRYPERFFDVGIAEQHAVTMAAGLAARGMRPVVAIYSTFLQRAYDQILHDVCLQKLPVVFCADRAGLVGEDGETHQGVYDVAYFLSMPYIQIWSPSTQADLAAMLRAALSENVPVVIRYPRGCLPVGEACEQSFVPGKWRELMPLSDVCVIASGRVLANARCACQDLNTGLVEACTVRPMDETMLQRLRESCKRVITVEDGLASQGLGMRVTEALPGIPVIRLGVPDVPVAHAAVARQDVWCGITVQDIRSAVLNCGGANA
ncbi:MAG: 1-deoxy-D-xylulose-5-phosphate synthase [Clostridia bacterium]|nr:1-deoxy-D-xylulose-5-phosphate synthase [Clostridia bacterium]